MPRKSISDFVQEAFTDPQYVGAGKPGLTMLSLVHKVANTDSEVYTWRFGEGEQSSAKSFEEAIQNKADSHVQDNPGPQTFNVLAFYGTTIPASRHIFIVNVPFPQDGNATEPATPQGRMVQMMRREEMLFAPLLAQTQFILNFQQHHARQLAEDNTALRTENFAMFQTFKEMVLKDIMISREHELAVLKAKENAKLTNKLLGFAPALVNTVAGREVISESKADSAIMDLICERIQPEHVEMLDGIFGPELGAVLKERVLNHTKKMEKEEAEMNALYPAGEDPEAEVSGEVTPTPPKRLSAITGGKKP
jgi:hypothetical protein